MAKSINIEFYTDATAKCSNCGSVYTLSANQKEINVEICGNCHPFYTGQDVVLDTAGRIEKFQARLAKSQEMDNSGKKKKKKKTRAIRQTIEDLVQDETVTPNEAKSIQAEKDKETKKDQEKTQKVQKTQEEKQPEQELDSVKDSQKDS